MGTPIGHRQEEVQSLWLSGPGTSARKKLKNGSVAKRRDCHRARPARAQAGHYLPFVTDRFRAIQLPVPGDAGNEPLRARRASKRLGVVADVDGGQDLGELRCGRSRLDVAAAHRLHQFQQERVERSVIGACEMGRANGQGDLSGRRWSGARGLRATSASLSGVARAIFATLPEATKRSAASPMVPAPSGLPPV